MPFCISRFAIRQNILQDGGDLMNVMHLYGAFLNFPVVKGAIC